MRTPASSMLMLSLSLAAIAASGCTKDSSTASTDAPTSAQTQTTTGGAAPTANSAPLDKLKIEDVKVGKGPGAQDGDRLTMTYTGKLKDGTIFDSNDKPDGKPFSFLLGAGSVIKGWDQGLVGMKAGGIRKLSIPASLGYGAQAQGDKIPANSDLFFTVTLKVLTKKGDIGQILRQIEAQGSGPAIKKGQYAVVNYTMSGDDGSVIDDTYAKKPYTFKVGNGDVLAVIDKAMEGLRAGAEMKLTIPAQYGPHGPNYMGVSTFIVDLKLLKIQNTK